MGASSTRETVAGVQFHGAVAVAYRACLWSRLANRVLLPVADFPAEDGDTLYRGLKAVDWGRLFEVDNTISIDFSGRTRQIRNTQFGAQRSKDAVVDWFQESCGRRPSVAKQPDVLLNVRLAKGRVRVALDFSGASLHRRGYRRGAGEAPLKENLAAAILLRADWPGMAARGGALIDPMCGSGTLLIEGAMMAADIAPGLARQRYGFRAWRDHNEDQWRALLVDANARAERGLGSQLPEIRGYDGDPRVIRLAEENIAAAGLARVVRVSCKSLAALKKPTHKPLPEGLLVCNPPYGERLGDKDALAYLYRQLGETMDREFCGWQAAVFTADAELGRATGLRSHKRYALWNGAIATTLLLFDLRDNRLRPPPQSSAEPAPAQTDTAPPELSPGALMFGNRLRKNRKRLSRWLRREGISCYRLYDADMPEYAVAVDVYGDYVHVAEYQAPDSVDAAAAERRLGEVVAALPDALGVAGERVVFKQRSRQRGSRQYQKQGEAGEMIGVEEYGARLLVNLRDYLDTGLFLDHRPLRRRIAGEASGADFLNLFCYTGSVTVCAALGGARSTTSVDLSNTYLGWLRKNLAHNGLDEARNRVLRADCVEWVQSERGQYDLILLDPPSFSNSAGMAESFDVQRDHPELVRAAMALLRPEGCLYFSNNRRGFRLAEALENEFNCMDISRETIDPDFERNAKIHVCWQIGHRRESVWKT